MKDVALLEDAFDQRSHVNAMYNNLLIVGLLVI